MSAASATLAHRPGGTRRTIRKDVVMAKDLPSRPPRDPDAPVTMVSATDRVKAKTDKLDPRFEAARQRLAKEEERRARAEATRQAKQAGDEPTEPVADAEAGDDAEVVDGAESADDDTTPEPPKKGFSFNQMSQPTKDAS